MKDLIFFNFLVHYERLMNYVDSNKKDLLFLFVVVSVMAALLAFLKVLDLKTNEVAKLGGRIFERFIK